MTEPTKQIFREEYNGESIFDLSRDITESLDERFNETIKSIPTDEHNLFIGTFEVIITWKKDL